MADLEEKVKEIQSKSGELKDRKILYSKSDDIDFLKNELNSLLDVLIDMIEEYEKYEELSKIPSSII